MISTNLFQKSKFITILLIFALSSLSGIKTQAETIATTSSLIKKGDIVFNEINWAGSSLSSTDEWIELYNNSDNDIDLKDFVISGAGTRDIKITGTSTLIKSGDYYLISRNDEANDNSALRIKPDFISSFTLSNSKFHLILKSGSTIVDEVDTKEEEPFAGESSTTLKTSMAKITPESESNTPESWKSSNIRINLDNKSTNAKLECGKDLSTPKSQNFSDVMDQTIIEFEESCFDEGEIKESGNTKFLAIKGEKAGYKAFETNYKFDEGANEYKAELFLKTSGLDIQNQNLGSFRLKFNEEINLKFENINSETFSQLNKLKFEFIKPNLLINSTIDFTINLNPNEELLLDKLVITKLSDENTNTVILGKDLFSHKSTLLLDPITGKTVKELGKENIAKDSSEYVIQDNFSTSLINTKNVNYNKVKYKIKFQNLDEELSRIDSLGRIEIRNPFTHSILTKEIRVKDIDLDKYKEYEINFQSEYTGTNNLSFISYGKSDIYIESIVLDIGTFPLSQKLDNLDLLNSIEFEYNDENNLVFNSGSNQTSKLLGINNAEYCYIAQTCEVVFEIKNFDILFQEDPSLRIGEIFVTTLDPDGIKKHEVLHLQNRDFNKDKFTVFSVKVPYGIGSKISFGFYTYNNSSLEIKDIKLNSIKKEIPSLNNLISLESQQRLDWSKEIKLKTNENDNGFEGKVIDVLSTKDTLAEGDYKFNLKVSKLEDFKKSERILSLSAYDENGKRLFNEELEENDLSFFDQNLISIEFSTTSSRKVFFEIKFFGNHFGAFSDLQLENIELSKV